MVETAAAFEVFWQQFPRHVGKLAALKAYTKARKLASAEQILAGVELYKQTKPAYADWCHPATFLRQGRWMDEPDAPKAAAEDWRCQHQPACPSPEWHQVTLARERGEIK